MRVLLDDARQVVRRRFARYFEGGRPYSLAPVAVPAAGMHHLGRAYAMAGRERRTYLLIEPVSALLLAVNRCGGLGEPLRRGLADYFALEALYGAASGAWPDQWEAQTSGEPASMVAMLAGFVGGVERVAAESFLRLGPGPLRAAVNDYMGSEYGFAAVEACFAPGAGLRTARLAGVLRRGREK